MAMGTRQTAQALLWVVTADLPASPGHPFYTRLNTLLDAHAFDTFVEGQCRRFYAPVMGRPGLTPGRYFRLLLLGYFEGIDSERGIAWRPRGIPRRIAEPRAGTDHVLSSGAATSARTRAARCPLDPCDRRNRHSDTAFRPRWSGPGPEWHRRSRARGSAC